MSTRDVRWLLLSLLGTLAWEASSWDLLVSGWFGGPDGFPWRDAPLLDFWLHDAARRAALVLLLLVGLDVWRLWLPGPPQRVRAWGFAMVLLAATSVPALKRLSKTSCPWDVDRLGGSVPHVPHWLIGVTDGGPGHCFPSGHVVSAFAFLALARFWASSRPALARHWLTAVWVTGIGFSAVQVVRGAHYVSHCLWSAWICWAMGMLGHSLIQAHASNASPRAGD